VNVNLTKKQKEFLDNARSKNLPLRFWVSGSLRDICLTIRFDQGHGTQTQYLLTIDDRIEAESKLKQVRHFFKTGEDIGCKPREIESDDDFIAPF
jgi:hypothetical protein